MEEVAEPVEISRLQMGEIARLLAADLPTLASLRLASREWREVVAETLAHLRPNRGITIAQLQHLTAAMPNLAVLDLSGCTLLTEGVLAAIAHLTHLTALHLQDCERLTEASAPPGALARLANLAELDCNACSSLTDRFFHDLPQLTKLAHLNLSRCFSLTGAMLEALRGLPALRSLNLQLCEGVAGAGLGEALAGLARLDDLDLSGCRGLEDASLERLCELTQLTRLDLSGCSRVTDIGLGRLSALGHLVCLSLVQCEGLTDVSLQGLGALRQLESLSLMSCKGPNDDVIAALLTQLPAMISLVLSGCPGVGEATARSLDALPHLFYLEIRFCSGLAPPTLVALLKRGARPALQRAAADAIWIVLKTGNPEPRAFHGAIPALVEIWCRNSRGALWEAADKALAILSEGSVEVQEAVDELKYDYGF